MIRSSTKTAPRRSWAAVGLVVVCLSFWLVPLVATTCQDLQNAQSQLDAAKTELQGAQWEVDTLRGQLQQHGDLNTGALQREVDKARQAYEATADERKRLQEAAEGERLKLVAANREIKAKKEEVAKLVSEWNTAQNDPGVKQVLQRIQELEKKIRSWIGNENLDPLGVDDLQDRLADASHLEALERIARVRSGFDVNDDDLKEVINPKYGGGPGSALENKYNQIKTPIGYLREWGAISSAAARVLPEIKDLANQIRGVRVYLGRWLDELETEREDNLRDARDQAGVKLAGIHTQADFDSRKSYLEREIQRAESQIGTEAAPGPLWQAWNNAKAKLLPFDDLKKAWNDAQARLDTARTQSGTLDVSAVQARLTTAEGKLKTAQAKVRTAETAFKQAQRRHQGTVGDIDSTLEGGRRAPGNARSFQESGQFQTCRDTVSEMTSALQSALSLYKANQSCLAGTHSHVPGEVARLVSDLGAVDCKPSSGPQITSGTTSGGTQPVDMVEVPPVENMYYQQAIARLHGVGLNAFAFEYRQAQKHEDDGKVTSATPKPGTKVPKGTTIDLAYNSNAVNSTYLENPGEPDTTNWITVPGVLNKHQTVARQLVSAAGLTPLAFEFRLAPSPEFNGIVTSQDPPPGDIVPPGTVVEIAYNTDWVPPDPAPTSPGTGAPTGAGNGSGTGGATTGTAGGANVFDPANPSPAGDPDAVSGSLPGESTTGQPASTESENNPPEPEWTRSGTLETVSEPEAPPPAGDAGGDAGGLLGMGEPEGPSIEGFVQQAEAAWSSCDFPTALNAGAQAAQLAPGHPWVTGRYPLLQTDAANYSAAQQMMRQAQSLLQSNPLTQEAVSQASALARQVQSTAPTCMSQRVSSLTPGIVQAEASVREASREQGRTSLLNGVTSLVTALGGAMNSAGVRGPAAVPSSGVGATGIDPSGVGGALGDALGGVLGGVGAGAGAPAAGPIAATPLNPAASAQGQPQCNGCFVYRAQYVPNGLIYLLGKQYTFQNQGGCTQGAVTAYQLFYFPPDKDSEGRPVNRSSAAEQYIKMSGARRMCGPCGSESQAQSAVRQSCPNPMTNVSWDPTRGLMRDGRPVPLQNPR